MSRMFDGISKIMYGTKKMVSAVLYFVPSVMFKSFLSPRIAALLTLTLEVDESAANNAKSYQPTVGLPI